MKSSATQPILRAENITKHFPGVTALKNVTFDLIPGEVHAVCGENGAGKSTFIKVLSGVHPSGSFDGALWVDGKTAIFTSVKDAEKAGIGVIYQELALVDEMSVGENIFLGSEPTRNGLIEWDKVFSNARSLLDKFGIEVDPTEKVEALGVGQRQLVEIAKALWKNTRILILDEPTAALTEQEVQVLLSILRDLRTKGIGCIYISHKLDEVLSIADRVTVLRDGETIVTLDAATADTNYLIRNMVGREIQDMFPKRESKTGRAMLQVRGLTVAARQNSKPILQDISFTVCGGEVLGIGGLMGSGRTELLTHIFGAWGYRISGSVALDGCELAQGNPAISIKNGITLITEDRKRYGLVLDQDVGFNLSLSSLEMFAPRGVIDRVEEFKASSRIFDLLRVKAPSMQTVARQLSGGNQQKLVIGKSLMTEPKVMLLDEPTRGIDVGAKIEVYELINDLTEVGHAVVLVSSELPELLGISNRILMLCAGRVGRVFSKPEATQENLLAAAMGHE